jgi:hypothetical protein
MATYNGISKAICLNCGKVTQDDSSLEIMNDLDPTCLTCGLHIVAWHDQDEIIVTTQKDPDSETERHTITTN